MADRYRRHRQPLAELPNTANTPPITTTATAQYTYYNNTHSNGKAALPHNVSLEANGTLVPRSQPTSPEHKRLSRLAYEDDPSSKRNSAISTTSTTASGNRRKTYIGHWQLGMTIGQGGCSRVRAVRHRYTQQRGAVKIVARSTAENTRAQSLANLTETPRPVPLPAGQKPIPFGLEREITLMKLLEHKNIVRLYDVWENHNELYLIMEHVEGGELFHYVEQRRGLTEIDTVIIFRQIVAALLYCHRVQVCHRDLKPENILLDPNTLKVKLIDFGMAALQPHGKLLSTPCGSPHYASPEVISTRPYNGKSADVWSCGVILYVMLSGSTPFNYSPEGEIKALFADIARANYTMPEGFSIEAKDLIKRMFVPDPKYRINLETIWHHPLLQKYNDAVEAFGLPLDKEEAIGPVPTLDDWTVKHASDIDYDTLRNMRTLWHSEPESHLIAKLLSKQVNQEKIFYAALMKHREEYLEDYLGGENDMNYSASDYHHSRPTKDYTLAAPLQQRSQSQYSILNDEHLRNSHSLLEAQSSIQSYDPYRASREMHARSARASVRQNKSLRVGMLKHNNRGSYHSSSSLARSARSRSSLRRSSLSKQSLSTAWPSSPPVISIKPSELHKKGVSFDHLRRTSTPSALLSQASTRTTPITPKHSGSPNHADVVRTRRAQLVQTPRALRSRKGSETPSQNIRSEIRKHSLELEKACEEAFFRSSVASTQSPTSSIPTDTPASSVSPNIEYIPARPLPDVPADTPTTFLTRTLKEFRAKLVTYNPAGESDAAHIGEAIKMIDNLVPTQQRSARRMTSAPEARVPDHLGHGLPIISEESHSDVPSTRYRSFTAPLTQKRDDQTIRMVPNSPGIASLSIRKRDDRRLSAAGGDLRRQKSYEAAEVLQAIDEDAVLPSAPIIRKKKSWFGLGKMIGSGGAQEAPTKRISEIEAETNDLPNDVSISVVSSEFPIRKKKSKGIGKWLSRRTTVVHEEHDTTAHNGSTESFLSASSPSPSVNGPVNPDKGRSWFARFLNIKPAQKIICFSIPRHRARQELIILLKEWQHHGIRDLQYCRETQSITARVDRQNSLNIKPVSFRVELFIVLEHGRRAGLSIARFTQVKGAVSGFRRVLEVVDGVMRSRNWLVEDDDKWKAMCEIDGVQ